MTEVFYKNQSYQAENVIERLKEFLTDERVKKIEEVLSHRKNHFIPVLEGIYDRGNISAVMRSAEAFGFSEMHIVELSKEFKDSQKRVTQGADKWLEVHKWSQTSECMRNLKDNGYSVYTTHLSQDAQAISEIPEEQKTAIVFGNEKEGVSEEALELSDGNVLLPMHGFTQSFNISVAAALTFQEMARKKGPHITEDKRKELEALYYLKTLDWPETVFKKVLG